MVSELQRKNREFKSSKKRVLLNFDELIGRWDIYDAPAPIVKPPELKFPHSIMSSLNHPVLVMKFINRKSFICATSKTSSGNLWTIVVLLFLYKALHLHRRRSICSIFFFYLFTDSTIVVVWCSQSAGKSASQSYLLPFLRVFSFQVGVISVI